MMDVRRPGDLKADNSLPKKEEARNFSEKEIAQLAPEAPIPERNIPWKSITAIVLILAVFGGGFFALSRWNAKNDALRSAQGELSRSGLTAEIPGVNLRIDSWQDLTTKVWPLMKGGFGAYQGLAVLADAGLRLNEDIGVLRKAAVSGLMGGGDDLSSPMKALYTDLSSLREASDNLDFSRPELKGLLGALPESYLSLKYKLQSFEELAGALSAWISGSRRIIVFLENSSEIRPTGGFWGSYMELNINNGKISSVQVRDVSEADRVISTKTIPPKPLQALVTNWRAADANWFFDFPASAAQGAKFLRASDLYKDDPHVDAVLSVSPKLIENILAVTGPISVSSTKAAIDKDNFLPMIQEEVQKGHDVGSASSKNILKEIYAGLIDKLSRMDNAEENQILSAVFDAAKNKDLVAYAEDPGIESALKEQGVAGDLFEVPQRFMGDYLGIAAANIGGGKSDHNIKEKITLESQIGANGKLTNHLEIARTHTATRSTEWWYKTINQAYLRIYTSGVDSVVSSAGGTKKTVYAPINYAKAGYVSEDAVKASEDSAKTVDGYPWLSAFLESGKTALASWLRVAPGETGKLSVDYTRRLSMSPDNGVSYQFVFDKQAGVDATYDFAFLAPTGLKWKESGSPVFEYKAEDIPARLTLRLTLISE